MGGVELLRPLYREESCRYQTSDSHRWTRGSSWSKRSKQSYLFRLLYTHTNFGGQIGPFRRNGISQFFGTDKICWICIAVLLLLNQGSQDTSHLVELQKRLAKMTLATCYHYHCHISFGRWSVFCHLVFHPHQKIFSPEEQRNGKQHYFCMCMVLCFIII